MVRLWSVAAFVAGAGLGVCLALLAGAVLNFIGAGDLLWTIPAVAAFGLVGLFALDMATRGSP